MFRNRLSRLFIKTFGITAGVVILIIAAGWLTLRQAVRPPIVTESQGYSYNGNQGNAFFIPKPEDAHTGDDLPVPVPPEADERKMLFYTFLIIGLDDGVNTDTIMVAAYDGTKKQAYVIGIPRDTKVNINRRTQKINAAFPIGTLNGRGIEGGINQLKREVKTIIGFVPDYYIVVDYNAFVRLVDAVNGVLIDVPFDMVYSDPYQDLRINIPKGLQTLYGEEALQFARYRRGNKNSPTISDYQRIEHQQMVIQAALKKLTTPSSILRIKECIVMFYDHVHTNIKMLDMLWFGEQLNEVRNNINVLETYTLPTTGTTGIPDWYELLDEEAVIELINRTVNPYLRDIGPDDLDIAAH